MVESNLPSKYAYALRRYDFSFFGTMIVIFIIGILNLYSATHATNDKALLDLYKTQAIWFCISIVVGVSISFIRPKTFFRYSYVVYGINVILLVLVLLIGVKVLGAKRWLDLGVLRLQPSEMMKISIVLVLARWYSKFNPEVDVGLKEMIIPGILALVPAVLVIVEPDLGTGLVLLLIFFIITFYRRLKWKTIILLVILGIATSGVMYKFGLKEYQRQRVITFLDPWGDAQGYGYNAIQSEIAIGSGQLFGKGFKKSSQASLSYLPENHTDFVFSIFNEEHGLFGSLVLITMYVVLIMRFIWLATSVVNFYDAVVSIGLMSIFFWHTFINMSMVTGLLPIVGIPLPLMSYGGSSLLTFGICCGIATSISNSRNLF
ncbi:MAG: rod shape-determining protein RodA [Oligoflexia bacterium]|nr:rod shape-determining protein RodA [Oligoflexia bacterium]MBF0365991.1 rod shape-determining protein RodA [Oligoflexia bacterium]